MGWHAAVLGGGLERYRSIHPTLLLGMFTIAQLGKSFICRKKGPLRPMRDEFSWKPFRFY